MVFYHGVSIVTFAREILKYKTILLAGNNTCDTHGLLY